MLRHLPVVDRRMWRMAGPIVLANVTVPLLGAVDTAVVGHLDAAYYLGAVAIGAMIFNFIYFGFNCLRMGTTGPTAQAMGAGERGEVKAILGRALFLAAAIGGLLVALQVPILALAFWLIDASAEVTTHAETYFLIRIWALPAALGLYAVIGWFFGLHDARVPLLLQFFINGINIALDLLFVLGLGWAVAGVAAASVIAEYAGLALALWIAWRRLGRIAAGAAPARILDMSRIARMLSINADIFLRTMCVVSVLAIHMAQSAKLGDRTLAANQVLYNFIQFMSFGIDGFANAAEALVGEAFGRRQRDALRTAVKATLRWAAFVALVFAAVYAVLGEAIVAVMTGLPEVRETAASYIGWCVAMPLLAVWAYAYDGIYLGATRTRPMLAAVGLSFALYIATVAVFTPAFGNHGLWAALAVFLSFRGVLLGLWYPRLERGLPD